VCEYIIAHSFFSLAQVLLIKATLDVSPTQSKLTLNNYVRVKGFQLGQLTLDTGNTRSEMKLLLVRHKFVLMRSKRR
jgi:hypothetical protein